MNTQTFRILSQTCLVAGTASIIGSLALWLTGRVRNDDKLQNDGIFVGLWTPSFYILADRLATASVEHHTRSLAPVEDNIKDRETPVQSPRPMSYVNR